ncbi:Type I restriction-modification system specificity determinant [Propionibacterium freudenreichii]|uniref:restriction endonuclease subunit S n=1 Tax=Propionibacterium freudenreichii TaxID=1744 RepID=UPI0005439740|nr:restriction endonuclease subunit S [Propionibacterium freudenreichii]CEG90071.1 Type I restriction-modification system specificity determinant [Propionibacterium freudenreichii]
MSQIEELVERLCPDGVTHVSLGNVVAYSTTTIDASELTETTFVGVDNLLPNKAGKTTARHGPNTARVTQFQEGDVLLGNIRPYLRKIWLADHSGGCSGDVLCIRIHDTSEISPGFLFQVLGSESFFRFFTKHSRGAKMPRGDKKEVLKYVLPVPPLEVQHEIVKILDTFTDLEAELEAELEARRAQYEYYRDQLLSFNETPPPDQVGHVE